MRNLKRALSLALASIMLLGMMVTGASAASNSFTDFDQIVNQEAAEVTSGLGIFDGYTDGSFGPEKVVTRAEMAVIICKLLNGSDVDPGNFTGISKFTDVPAWAEGYVNYCAAAGIVVGVGEGKFNPSATVTTVEAATMLLKALGYFTEEDKLKEDWKTVVTGRATGMKLYGTLTLAVDEGLTRDNVAELVFNTLFAQRVAYDDNRQLYVKNTNRDVVVTNGTQDYLNTFAENTFHMWVVDGLVTANSFTNDDLSETTNNAPRTNVVFDEAAAQDYPATAYQGSTGSEYPFEYTTGLDMIGHAARVYYRMERNAPVVFAIADRATKVEYITYDANETNLSNAANEAGFRRNTIRQISEDDYKVNYAWDVTVGTLKRDSSADNDVDLTGSNKWEKNDPAKTLLVISNSTDNAVDYVIVLDQYLDTVKRVVTKNDVTEYDLTTIDGVDQNILHGDAAQGDYVVVTDIGKQGDMLNFELAEKVSANITKITGKSDDVATVKSIIADGTTYVGSPVYDFRPQNSSLEDTTDFEAIETIGEATLLLDAQGKCIGLAQPESTPNYAYAAQFGVWHTGGSLNTEFKLTVKLYFLDGTSGVYLVNTDASKSSNTFYDLKMGVDETIAEGYRDMLNGVDKEHGVPYSPLKTYDPQHIGVTGTTLNNLDETKESGLGIYKATVRADDTVVLKALGEHDAVASTFGDATKLIPGHSTLVKANGQNLTCPKEGDVLFQDNKTVYFYVSGTYDNDLSVGAKYGVSNAVGITNSDNQKANLINNTALTVDGKDKDNNGENDTIVQILTSDGGRKYEEKKETVEAVLVWGYDLGSSDTMYFYRQNSYDIEHKDNASSRAGEKLYTITYHMYTADGEPYEAHFDNGGKYYDMETAKETVSDKPTGFYTLGSKDINGKWTSNETDKIFYVKNNVDIGTTDGAKNVYVLNAVAKHDTYVDNLYTHVEDVGGIIPSTAKVVSTVDNCNFDSINEIARACDNGALVKISYCYSTSDYKIKTVFITEYNKEGGTIANAGADLWSYYSAPWLYVFNDISKPASYIEVANSAKAALEKAGFTVTNMQPAGMTQNSKVFWTIEATMGGTKYFFTNGPTGMGFGTNGFNYYVNIVRETVRVRINGNIATNGGVVKEGYCLPNTTIRVSDKTVVTGNVYDVMRNNGANYAFVKEDSVTATNNQIVYNLPANIEGYTVDFRTDATKATIKTGAGVQENIGVTFDNKKNETAGGPGSTVEGELTIAAASRAEISSFASNKSYTLVFSFSGTQEKVTFKDNGNGTNTLKFSIVIPTGAKAVNGKVEITLDSVTEGSPIDTTKTQITEVTFTGADSLVVENNGTPSKVSIATEGFKTAGGTWRDGDGKIAVKFEDGKIYTLNFNLETLTDYVLSGDATFAQIDGKNGVVNGTTLTYTWDLRGEPIEVPSTEVTGTDIKDLVANNGGANRVTITGEATETWTADDTITVADGKTLEIQTGVSVEGGKDLGGDGEIKIAGDVALGTDSDLTGKNVTVGGNVTVDEPTGSTAAVIGADSGTIAIAGALNTNKDTTIKGDVSAAGVVVPDEGKLTVAADATLNTETVTAGAGATIVTGGAQEIGTLTLGAGSKIGDNNDSTEVTVETLAVEPGEGTTEITINGTVTANEISIPANATGVTITVNGTLTLGGEAVSGEMDLGNGNKIVVVSSESLHIASAVNATVEVGDTTDAGALVIENGGSLAGDIKLVNGSVTVKNGGTLDVTGLEAAVAGEKTFSITLEAGAVVAGTAPAGKFSPELKAGPVETATTYTWTTDKFVGAEVKEVEVSGWVINSNDAWNNLVGTGDDKMSEEIAKGLLGTGSAQMNYEGIAQYPWILFHVANADYQTDKIKIKSVSLGGNALTVNTSGPEYQVKFQDGFNSSKEGWFTVNLYARPNTTDNKDGDFTNVNDLNGTYTAVIVVGEKEYNVNVTGTISNWTKPGDENNGGTENGGGQDGGAGAGSEQKEETPEA